jgi:hypothetical protein
MIDRENIRVKVKQAIKMLPTIGIVYRDKKDIYNSRLGLEEITTLEGLFYTEERSSLKDINLTTPAMLPPKKHKNFLTIYNEETLKVQQGDLIKIDGEFFRIDDVGENLQIYCLMDLVRHNTEV